METLEYAIDYEGELAHGIACQRAGHATKALASLRRVASGAPATLAAQAYVHMSVVYRSLGQVDEAREYAQRAATVATAAGEISLLQEALNAEGSTYLQLREFAQAEAIFREILASIGEGAEAGEMKARGLALSNLAVVRAERGALEEARSYFTAAHTCFRLAEYPYGIPLALHNLGAVCLDQGDMDAALGYLLAAQDEATQAGDLELASLAGVNIGEAIARGGSPERAGKHVREAIGGFSAAGNRSRRCYAVGVYALVAELSGERETAVRAYEAALREAGELSLTYLQERYAQEISRLLAVVSAE